MRPRFIVALCFVALLLAGLEMLDLIAGPPTAVRFGTALLGLRFAGDGGSAIRTIEAVALCVGALGLWNLRAWARLAAMAYLAAVILSFLFLGVGTGRDRAAWTLLWQVSVVPFATFCFMFLYNGRRYFSGANALSGTRPGSAE